DVHLPRLRAANGADGAPRGRVRDERTRAVRAGMRVFLRREETQRSPQRSPQRKQGAASHLLALRARMAHLLALRARMAHLLALRARMAHLLALRARMRFFRAGVICASALVPVLCTVYSVRALGARSNQFCPTSRALTSF